LEGLIKLYQGRINRLSDFLDWADFFFLDKITIEQKLREKFFTRDLSKEFSMFIERLDRLEPFTIISIEETFRDLVKQRNISSRQLIHPIRVALTGKTIGPGLFDVIFYLGKEKTNARLKRCVKTGG
jgi:glutamyl/glutaminyl-tRNA synthetase